MHKPHNGEHGATLKVFLLTVRMKLSAMSQKKDLVDYVEQLQRRKEHFTTVFNRITSDGVPVHVVGMVNHRRKRIRTHLNHQCAQRELSVQLLQTVQYCYLHSILNTGNLNSFQMRGKKG